MKAILTYDGARRIGRPDLSGQEVEIADLRTMPWGSRNATVIVSGLVVARNVSVYTEGRSETDFGLMLIIEEGT